MKTLSVDLIEQLLELPREERELLMARLADSLDDEDEAAVEQAWIEEAKRRIEEIETGQVQCVPGDEVFRKLRARFE